jgi:SAM-dependent methyltransferase
MSQLYDILVGQNMPLPPPRLRYKVAGTDIAEWFEKSGQMSVQDLMRALASVGMSLDEFTDVLEWGCGCGRILRHLPSFLAPKRIYGNDIDPEAIAWVNENLPWVETSLTNGMPPLPYRDNSFDLIFNHSVMTHLDETYQDAWLAELSRVLRPGGIVTLTASGPNAFQMFLDTFPPASPDRIIRVKEMHTAGIVYIAQDQWTADFPDFYHTTFHDAGYVFNHWSKFLTLRSYIQRGALDYQDMIVLQKPVDGAVMPREYQDYANVHRLQKMGELQRSISHLQHEKEIASRELPREREVSTGKLALAAENAKRQMELAQDELRQSAEDLRRVEAALQQADFRLQQVYASRSWLLTKPWRYAGRFIKKLGS